MTILTLSYVKYSLFGTVVATFFEHGYLYGLLFGVGFGSGECTHLLRASQEMAQLLVVPLALWMEFHLKPNPTVNIYGNQTGYNAGCIVATHGQVR